MKLPVARQCCPATAAVAPWQGRRAHRWAIHHRHHQLPGRSKSTMSVAANDATDDRATPARRAPGRGVAKWSRLSSHREHAIEAPTCPACSVVNDRTIKYRRTTQHGA